MMPTPLRQERTTEEFVTPILTLGLQALGQRVLLWAVTLGAGAIWLVAIRTPDLWHLLGASLYCITVLWPFLWKDRRGE